MKAAQKFSVPKGVAIKTLLMPNDASAIILGIERTNTEHGLFLKGTLSSSKRHHL